VGGHRLDFEVQFDGVRKQHGCSRTQRTVWQRAACLSGRPPRNGSRAPHEREDDRRAEGNKLPPNHGFFRHGRRFLDPDAEAKSLKNRDGGAVSEIVGQVFSCLGRLRRQIWCQASVRSLRTRRRTPAGNGGVKRGVTRMANRPSLIRLGMRQENGGCAPHEMCHALRVHRPSTNSMANAARPNRRRRIQRSFAASGHAH
jgi:hypothetical protein